MYKLQQAPDRPLRETNWPHNEHVHGNESAEKGSWGIYDKVKQMITKGCARALRTVTGTCLLEVTYISKHKLRHGDLLRRPKILVDVQSTPDSLPDTCQFFHHGIYINDASGEYVVGFTSVPRRAGAAVGEGHDETDGVAAYLQECASGVCLACRTLAMDVCGGVLTNLMKGNRIVEEMLDSYRCGNGNYILNDAAVRDDAADRANRTDVAKFFLQHPQAFGRYDMVEWNCQHFISFCCTTRLSDGELQRELRRVAAETGAFSLSMDYLQAHGTVVSEDMERYKERGLCTIFLRYAADAGQCCGCDGDGGDEVDGCCPRTRSLLRDDSSESEDSAYSSLFTSGSGSSLLASSSYSSLLTSSSSSGLLTSSCASSLLASASDSSLGSLSEGLRPMGSLQAGRLRSPRGSTRSRPWSLTDDESTEKNSWSANPQLH